MVQTVESTAANTCMLLSVDQKSGLDTNFRAQHVTEMGPISVQGRTCTQFSAMRADGKSFTYSVEPNSASMVCDIRVGRTVYTMLSFTPHAPRPEYSPACKSSFDAVLINHKSKQNTHPQQDQVPVPAAHAQALSRAARAPHPKLFGLSAAFVPQFGWNPWDDAKEAFDDVEHWAGDVYNWAKAHFCELCEPIMDRAIDTGSEIGGDFICDAATEGAAADFCGQLAEDAVKEGCDLVDCAKHICNAIGGHC